MFENAIAVRVTNNDAFTNAINVYVVNADEFGGGGGGAVSSVNGKTGVVVLSASDIKTSSAVSVEDELLTIETRIDALENAGGSGGTIQSINDANDVNIDTSKLAMIITDEQTQMVSQAEILKRVDLDLYKAIGTFGATDATTTITHSGTTYTTLNWTNLTISDVGINYDNGTFTSTTRNGKISIKMVLSGYKNTTYSPYIAILKNGVQIKEILHQGNKGVTSINEIEVTDVDFVVGDVFSLGIRPYNASNGGQFVINNIPTTLNLSANGGGTREVIKLNAIEDGFATKEYTNTTFLPTTELPNVLAHTEISQLADVNIDKTRGTFQLSYLNPVTKIFEGIDLVEEALNYNNILVHPVAGNLSYGDNDITFNTTPEQISGTLFTPQATGIKINQPTNGISLKARLKLIGTGIDASHPLDVNVKLLQNNTTISELNTTLTSNTPLTSVIDNMIIDANVNDLIHIRVNYTDNGNHPTLSLDGTGYIQLYNANENAIKFPNIHLQAPYYTNGTILTPTLTTTYQNVISYTFTDNVRIDPRDMVSRLTTNRTGGGQAVGLMQFQLVKNGVAEELTYDETIARDEDRTMAIDNIKQYHFNSGDTMQIQAKYTGSGTTSVVKGTYTIFGMKI